MAGGLCVSARTTGHLAGPRATRRGYQRAAAPPQSTGRARAAARGAAAAYRPGGHAHRQPLPVDRPGRRRRHGHRLARVGPPRTPLGRGQAAGPVRRRVAGALRPRARRCACGTGTSSSRPTVAGGTLFTMDLVRGGNLEQLLARHGPLPDAYVRVVLEQVLEALVAVHAAGVVHRDVKPGNLLLEPTGTGRPWVRLGDFGIAVVAGDPRLTRAPGGVGTGGYMAPEQAAGAAPDPRQDLYAAGVVATQLLTGRPPGAAAPDSRPGPAAGPAHRSRPGPSPGQRRGRPGPAARARRAGRRPVADRTAAARRRRPGGRRAAARRACVAGVRLGGPRRLRRGRARRRPGVVGGDAVSLRRCRPLGAAARAPARPRRPARRHRWPRPGSGARGPGRARAWTRSPPGGAR